MVTTIGFKETAPAKEAYEFWRDENMKGKAQGKQPETFLREAWRAYTKAKELTTPFGIWERWYTDNKWMERYAEFVQMYEDMRYRGHAVDNIERMRSRLEKVSMAGVEVASKSFVELMAEIKKRGPLMFENMSDKDLLRYFESYTKIIPNLIAIAEALSGFEAMEEIFVAFKARSDADDN